MMKQKKQLKVTIAVSAHSEENLIKNIYIYMYIHLFTPTFFYIYIYRERERGRERVMGNSTLDNF